LPGWTKCRPACGPEPPFRGNEVIPERAETTAEGQEVPDQEAALEIIRAQKDKFGDKLQAEEDYNPLKM
jgi:hypothetical protein